MELVSQVDTVDFLTILGDQATCEDAMHQSFDTRMMEEGDRPRELFIFSAGAVFFLLFFAGGLFASSNGHFY